MKFNIKALFGGKKEVVKPLARSGGHSSGTLVGSYIKGYDGEKNFGEIGPVISYRPDYEALRLRSWQSWFESEITQMIVNRQLTWIVGKGLALQSQPALEALRTEGINVTSEKKQELTEIIESRWKVFAESQKAFVDGETDLHQGAERVKKNAFLGGDTLINMRVRNGRVVLEQYDGADVCSPVGGDDYWAYVKKNGRLIRNGIEMDKRGKHLAYYVKDERYQITRIPAYSGVTGDRTAFMVYGMKARLNNTRGLPLVSVILETLAKLDRYKEATVGSAEEVAKIAYQIVHKEFSTGQNPLKGGFAKAFDASNTGELPKDDNGEQLAKKVYASTNKQAFNNPVGAEIRSMESGNKELYFADFYDKNVNIVCAALGIPPDVAKQMFDGSYSASRAALKDWEHSLNLLRDDLAKQYYQRVYQFWLNVEIMKGKVMLPGYEKGDDTVKESWLKSRWVGATVPHIDPVKEARAVRIKLGANADGVPLTTVERATEELNGGDYHDNLDQFANEMRAAERLGINMREAPES